MARNFKNTMSHFELFFKHYVVAVLRGNCPEQQSYMTVKILSTQKATKNKEPLWQ